MELRKRQEEAEIKNLSPHAAKSAYTRGREIPEEPCDIRTEFQRDRDRIIHSKAFRRLKDKMQVFIAPGEDHIRTRLSHTLEVSQIARTISRALSLNEDLTEAIALGHDLGHTPFGHAGEDALNKISPYGFEHNRQSLRVAEKLEREGRGLRLTWEVRDGILNHRTGMSPATLEGKVVQLSDKIAYLNHDIEDSIKSGVISQDDVPEYVVQLLGDTGRKRINTMIRAVISESACKSDIIMEKSVKDGVAFLRDFMFENVYMAKSRLGEKQKITHVITRLYGHYLDEDDTELEEFAQAYGLSEEPRETMVCDFISGMTDRYALTKFGEVFLPYAHF